MQQAQSAIHHWRYSPGALPLTVLLLLPILTLMSASSLAQNDIVTTEVRPSMQASPIPADMEVQLDGLLDEDAWAEARPITEFRQQGAGRRWGTE